MVLPFLPIAISFANSRVWLPSKYNYEASGVAQILKQREGLFPNLEGKSEN